MERIILHPDNFKVSIIISSFNHKKYLIEAVESVMAQTLRPHEIIIADDGSTDGSHEVILNYVKQYPDWIKSVMHTSNVGIPKNRNAALRTVTGNYVGILDGDDLFLPNKLELQYNALCALPGAKAAYGNFYLVGPDGSKILDQRYSEPQPEGAILGEVAKLHYAILRTMIADYDAVKAAGFMDERYTKYDGFWLSIKLAATCQFAYVHAPLILKREHPQSDSRKNTSIDLLNDLTGIYNDMQPIIGNLNQEAIKHIKSSWQKELIQLCEQAINTIKIQINPAETI